MLRKLWRSILVMLGAEPHRPVPEDYSPEARELHQSKQGACHFGHHTKEQGLCGINTAPRRHVWRNRRWLTLLAINLIFVVSYRFDVQLVEGALTASRVIGFHFADLNSALQVTLAFKTILINLIIGTGTVLFLWWLFGGRSFCSWCCPYHLLAEWVEALHLKLAAKGWVKDHPLDRRLRTVLYVAFAVLSFATGYTVYETISPTGIVSRALIYGLGFAFIIVVVLLLIELLYSRRMWCRYMCPIGITYGLVGAISPTRVVFEAAECHHEGACRTVCLVPHVLDCTKKCYATETQVGLGADCTRCGLCVDICPTNALKFKIKGLDSLL